MLQVKIYPPGVFLASRKPPHTYNYLLPCYYLLPSPCNYLLMRAWNPHGKELGMSVGHLSMILKKRPTKSS